MSSKTVVFLFLLHGCDVGFAIVNQGQMPMGQMPMDDEMGQMPMGQEPMGDGQMFEMGQVPVELDGERGRQQDAHQFWGQKPVELESFGGQEPMGQEPMGQEPMGQEIESDGLELLNDGYGGGGYGSHGGYGSQQTYSGGSSSYSSGHYVSQDAPKSGYGSKYPGRRGYSKTSWQSKTGYGSGPKPLKYTGYGHHLTKGYCTDRLMAPMNSNLECFDQNTCSATCVKSYNFPNGQSQIGIVCSEGRWVVQGTFDTNIPTCSPVCLPGCENGGACVSPNLCSCPSNFYGPYCQYERKPCRSPPALPNNSRRTCTDKECKIQCVDGHVFPDGSTSTELHCKDGVWEPLRRDWVSVPDCQPVCTPPCQNGGVCLGLNSCQCPQEFRGFQCQYSASACDVRSLSFNGNYKCNSNSNKESLECVLRCPDGMKMAGKSAAASTESSVHVCSYANGTFYPPVAPRCVFGESEDLLLNYVFPDSPNPAGGSYHQHYYYSRGSSSKGGSSGGQETMVDFIYPSQPYESETEWICYTWNSAHFRSFNGKIKSMKTEGDCKKTLMEAKVHHKTLKILAPTTNECLNGRCSYFLAEFGDVTYNFSSSPLEKLKIFDGQKFYSAPQKFAFEKVEMGPKSMIFSTDSKLKIQWDLQDTLSITIDKKSLSSSFGICGSIEETAYQKSAEVYKDFGDSCEIQDDQLCLNRETERRAEKFCNGILTEVQLSPCRKLINPEEFLETCKWDYCACEIGGLLDHDCGCKSIEMYVKECRDHGVEVSDWRSPSFCPMKCKSGKIYQECGIDEACGRSALTEEEHQSRKKRNGCDEGCYCPPGTFLHNGTCLTKSQCPCTLRGKHFPPGQLIPKDCNTCTCSDGRWVCTKLECSARCEAVGDPHYITFDKKSYEFMGKCSYVLVETADYTVEAENVPCDGAVSESMGFTQRYTMEPPTCTKSVTIRIGESTVLKLKQGKQVSVNGMDHPLPITLPSAHVRKASSIFIQVDLSDGLDVMWDGSTRVYIHAPPSLKQKTKGLCGTFNGHQSDDFLTPENDVEVDPIVFGNKWKTKDSCLANNSSKRDLENCPADLRREAETICNKLIELDLFKDCELGSEKEVYRDFCLYDVCSCSHRAQDCYCPIFSSLADRCSKAGYPIDWRSKIRECGLRCPRGQVYEICGSTCSRSCADVSRGLKCVGNCVEGCYCPAGYAMDRHEMCIPVNECPCVKKGLDYPAGHKELRRDAKGTQLCTCANAIWECHTASAHELALYSNSTDEDDKACSATENKVYTHCEPSTPITCQNMHKKGREQSEKICYGGCVCKRGFVLDSASGACVRPEECPCHHGGRSYGDGRVIQKLCNTCVCKAGKWNCTDHLCPSSCSTWGDSHFRTFDGKIYDFQGSCEYVLAKGALSPAPTDCFSVIVELVPCGSTGVSCAKSVSLHVGQGDLKESLVLEEGKKSIMAPTNRILQRETGNFIFAEVPELGIVLQWDKGTRINVRLDTQWRGKVKGLCGNYNADYTDDFTSPSGGLESSLEYFGDSWKIHDHCPQAAQVKDTCEANPKRREWALEKCSVLKSSIFTDCHTEVQIDPYMERCVFDACGCDEGGDCDCLCTAIAAYAQECNAHGVHIKWRSQQLCPLQCDEKCSEYSPCVSTCPHENCDNLLTSKGPSSLCKQDTCIEGCLYKKCPEGQVYRNSTNFECIPTADCKPVCISVNGTDYFEGDLIESDNCHRCYCSRGRKTCSGEPCPQLTTEEPPFNESPITCVTGWSSWINSNNHVPNSMENEVEPLPLLRDFRLPSGSEALAGRCSVDKMVDIRCRTVEGHLNNKESGEEAECSLERGLFCTGTCSDYEIQVLCQCEPVVSTLPTTVQTTSKTTTSPPTTTTEVIPTCDIYGPLRPHISDCGKYYQCMDTLEGPQLVERECGGVLLFNSVSLFCDDAKTVIARRPECKGLEYQDEVTVKADYHANEVIEGCGADEIWDECAYDCEQMCHHARLTTFITKCTFGVKCIAGCRPRFGCPVGKRWRDYRTCVSTSDCTCSADGVIMKPGEVRSPEGSPCKVCQCLNNEYVCDDSACHTTVHEETTVTSPTTILTTEDIIILESTVSPPPDCESERFVPLLIERPDSAFTASSSNTGHLPSNARMTSGSSWRPVSDATTTSQWLQVDLGEPRAVYGISIKGDATYDAKLKTFRVLFSLNGVAFSYIGSSIVPKVFKGPIDNEDAATRMFSVPIEARYIRVVPLTWSQYPALRIELLGCDYTIPTTTTATPEITTTATTTTTTMAPTSTSKPVCTDKMSISMDDRQLRASSSSSALSQELVSVYGSAGWSPLTMDKNQWLEFDFLGPRTLTGVMIAGDGSAQAEPSWVKTFSVSYSHNGKDWNMMVDKKGQVQKFKGNRDSKTIATVMFWEPVNAAYMRIKPLSWNNKIVLRAQILGCYEAYPELPPLTTTTTEQPTTAGPCQLCPGATLSDESACPCSSTEWWTGDACSSRAKCPCFVGFISYAIGTVFDSEDCEQCTCALNGVAQCEPKKCPPCGKGLRRVTTNLCSCTCEPCPLGQVLCPTSNICIRESSWCDGVMDCPDDEINCTVSTTAPPTEAMTTSRPTTTTEAPKLEECPEVECPPGYLVNMTETVEVLQAAEEAPAPWSPFGKKSKWGNAFRTKGGYGGHAGTKGGYQKGHYKGRYKGYGNHWTTTTTTTTTPKPQVICPKYQCLPIEEQAIQVCEKPSCKDGYTLTSMEAEEGKCPHYSCVLKIVELPNSECNVTGRSFATFDGIEYKYDICDHVLALKDDQSWSVKKLKKCNGLPKGPCLVIKHNSDVFLFTNDLDSWLNDYHYTIPQLQKIGAQKLEFAVRQVSDSYIIFTSLLDFSVIWDSSGNVRIIVPGVARGHVDGLCGHFDGQPDNDRRKPNGELARSTSEFGDSWGNNTECETLACPLHVQKAAHETCKAFKQEPLSQCSSVVNLEKLVSQCMEAVCACAERGNTTEQCRCPAILEGVTECQTLLPKADLAMWRVNNDCPVKCPDGLVYKACFNKVCEPCCAELMLEDACPTADRCFPGCYCPDGLVRSYDKCVRPSDCRDCQCDGIGGTRFFTFDRADYTFNSKCTHVLAQTSANSQAPQFKVWITNKPCLLKPDETCLHAVTLIYKDNVIQVVNDRSGEPSVIVDGLRVPSSSNGTLNWGKVTEHVGRSVSINIPEIHMDLEVLSGSKGFSLKIPSHLYRDKTEGLCGSCNVNTTDDFKMMNGSFTDDILAFGESWQVLGQSQIIGLEDHCQPIVEKACQPPAEDQPDPCRRLLVGDLSKCHYIIDPSPYLDGCHESLCAGTSYCASLEAYARQCQSEGLCLNWRDTECPYTCPAGLEYEPCGTGCTLTCENFELLRNSPDTCLASRGDTCNCPSGKVLRNDSCVEERLCKPCDAEGHFAGDIWRPDVCTECTCESSSSIQCKRITCSESGTVCSRGFRSITITSNVSECCPKHICVPEPTPGTVCPEPVQPQCGFGQILKLETSSAGCQEFICQCQPKEDCEDVSVEMKKQLAPGMIARLDESGCCPKVVTECEKDKCPPPPLCPPHHIAVERDTELCCPTYRCAIPEGKCLYDLSYASKLNGGERPRLLLERENILKDKGDRWTDGPCRSCECGANGKAECTVTTCQDPPESDHYTYAPEQVNDKCCPIYKRTACKVGRTVYQVGQIWPTSNPCINESCVLSDSGELSKLEVSETCKKDCQQGWIYQEPPQGKCCGECKANGCLAAGKLHKSGEIWLSSDNCTAFECIIENNLPQIISSQEKCPDISDCPAERIYQDTCCKKCNTTVPENHSSCAAESLALEKTIGLINVTVSEHGRCTNEKALIGFTECYGTCDSYTKYNSILESHESKCLCCKADELEQLLVSMTCDDGFTVEKYVAIPKTCKCSPCDEQLKRSRYVKG
ncbi:Hypothetical protein NTJ_09116 [Nesidiocoris tenuis]|uniref:Hemocytin n=2 Tax=Nesidiocoris tenuis TaxID=355587 RepID=A0ABN7B0Q1_9HEMI|nr:Hypothetical protein NTJ_09116 [Nesidiocoris tenuis]